MFIFWRSVRHEKHGFLLKILLLLYVTLIDVKLIGAESDGIDGRQRLCVRHRHDKEKFYVPTNSSVCADDDRMMRVTDARMYTTQQSGECQFNDTVFEQSKTPSNAIVAKVMKACNGQNRCEFNSKLWARLVSSTTNVIVQVECVASPETTINIGVDSDTKETASEIGLSLQEDDNFQRQCRIVAKDGGTITLYVVWAKFALDSNGECVGEIAIPNSQTPTMQCHKTSLLKYPRGKHSSNKQLSFQVFGEDGSVFMIASAQDKIIVSCSELSEDYSEIRTSSPAHVTPTTASLTTIPGSKANNETQLCAGEKNDKNRLTLIIVLCVVIVLAAVSIFALLIYIIRLRRNTHRLLRDHKEPLNGAVPMAMDPGDTYYEVRYDQSTDLQVNPQLPSTVSAAATSALPSRGNGAIVAGYSDVLQGTDKFKVVDEYDHFQDEPSSMNGMSSNIYDTSAKGAYVHLDAGKNRVPFGSRSTYDG